MRLTITHYASHYHALRVSLSRITRLTITHYASHYHALCVSLSRIMRLLHSNNYTINYQGYDSVYLHKLVKRIHTFYATHPLVP